MGCRHPIAFQDGFDEGFGFLGVDFEYSVLPGFGIFLVSHIKIFEFSSKTE
jgi:hypothetical protein